MGHVKVVLTELMTEQSALDSELSQHFDPSKELSSSDGFPRKMFPFAKTAKERLAALGDLRTLAEGTYKEALKYYGEDAASIGSTQVFFGTFQTFVSSYKVCLSR